MLVKILDALFCSKGEEVTVEPWSPAHASEARQQCAGLWKLPGVHSPRGPGCVHWICRHETILHDPGKVGLKGGAQTQARPTGLGGAFKMRKAD